MPRPKSVFQDAYEQEAYLTGCSISTVRSRHSHRAAYTEYREIVDPPKPLRIDRLLSDVAHFLVDTKDLTGKTGCNYLSSIKVHLVQNHADHFCYSSAYLAETELRTGLMDSWW